MRAHVFRSKLYEIGAHYLSIDNLNNISDKEGIFIYIKCVQSFANKLTDNINKHNLLIGLVYDCCNCILLGMKSDKYSYLNPAHILLHIVIKS